LNYSIEGVVYLKLNWCLFVSEMVASKTLIFVCY